MAKANMISHFVEMGELEERLRKIEKVLVDVFDNDDENVVSLIVGDIRKIEGLEDFAEGAHSDDHIVPPDPCPYCGSSNIVTKVLEIDSHDNRIYAKESSDWMYPWSYCKCCERYLDYKLEEEN